VEAAGGNWVWVRFTGDRHDGVLRRPLPSAAGAWGLSPDRYLITL